MARARAVLWVAVLVRLLWPPGFATPVGLSVTTPTGTAALGPAVAPGLFLVWVSCAGLFAALGLWRLCATRRRLRLLGAPAPTGLVAAASRAADRLGMRRQPGLRVLPGHGSPFLCGMLRPVVYVPADLVRTLSPAELEHVLLHELAHAARRDPWRAAAALLVQVLFWFHPAAWLACARLRVLREMATDERARSVLPAGDAGYASTLRGCARRLLLGPVPGMAMLGMRRQIFARLEQLDRPRPRRPRAQVVCASALAAALLACSAPGAGPYTLPPDVAVGDLPGCMQKRLLVLAAMARAGTVLHR